MWSKYTPLEDDEPIPFNFEKQATSKSGEDYKVYRDVYVSAGRGGIRSIYLSCHNIGVKNFRV